MIRDRELHEVSWDAFVAKDRPWIFDRGAQVKILRLRIVGGNEKETGRVLIINTRWIHETTRASRLECFRQLPNFKLSEVVRQSDKLMRLQKIDHLLLPAFVRLQKRLLIGRNILGAGRVRIGHGWVRWQRFESAIT